MNTPSSERRELRIVADLAVDRKFPFGSARLFLAPAPQKRLRTVQERLRIARRSHRKPDRELVRPRPHLVGRQELLPCLTEVTQSIPAERGLLRVSPRRVRPQFMTLAFEPVDDCVVDRPGEIS